MKNFISLNIKHLCDSEKLSQNDFGELFGLKKGVVNTYTRGKTNPQIETIQLICAHFKIAIDDFINRPLSEVETNAVNEDSPTYEVANYKSQLKDKDRIIELLEFKLSLYEAKDEKRSKTA